MTQCVISPPGRDSAGNGKGDGTRIPRRGCARGRADAKRSESLEVHQTEDKGASFVS